MCSWRIHATTDRSSQSFTPGSKNFCCRGTGNRSRTVRTLLKDRNEDSFDLFWNHTLMWQTKMDVNDPVLPHKRKTPTRFEQGPSVTYAFFESPKDFYRQKYYDAYDFVINAIQDRFDQKDFKVYKSIQDLLLKSIKKEDFDDEFNVVVEIYRDDVNDYLLKTQPSRVFSRKLHPILTWKRSTSATSLHCFVASLQQNSNFFRKL